MDVATRLRRPEAPGSRLEADIYRAIAAHKYADRPLPSPGKPNAAS